MNREFEIDKSNIRLLTECIVVILYRQRVISLDDLRRETAWDPVTEILRSLSIAVKFSSLKSAMREPNA